MAVTNNGAIPHLSTRDFRRLLGISIFQKRKRTHSKALLMTINAPADSPHPPFIWFGDAWFADKLSLDQTIYCIPSGRIQIENTETFIKAMAHHCLDEILAVQPVGPYLLGGFCFDAWIAYEVALLLKERGHETSLLAMIECYTLDRGEQKFNAFAHHFNMLAKGPLRQRVAYLQEIAMKERTEKEPKLSGGGGAPVNENGESAPSKCDHATLGSMPVEDQVNLLTKYALQSYVPRSSGLSIDLIFGADSWHSHYYRLGPYLPLLRFGWLQTISGEIVTHFTPGNHDTILGAPNVDAMAQLVQACIDRARLGIQP